MTLRELAASAAIAALTPLAAQADTAANRALVIEALTETFVKGNVAAVDTYFAPGYIQHNPNVPSGTDAFKGLVDMLSKNDAFKLEVVRVIGDGDMVALHSRFTRAMTGLAQNPWSPSMCTGWKMAKSPSIGTT